jgi:HEAT repeats
MKNSKQSVGRILAACCAMFCTVPFASIAAAGEQPSARAARPVEALAPPLRYRFVAGEKLIYRVSYGGIAQTDFRVLFGGQNQSAGNLQSGPLGLAQRIEVKVQGQLLVTVVEVKDHGVVLAYSLHDAVVKLIVNGQEEGANEATIKNDLSRDVFAALDPRGKVLSVRFDPATEKFSQNFARALLGATQFVLPGEGSGGLGEWQTQEEDPNGQYVARYLRLSRRLASARSSARGSVTLQKTITHYIPATAKPSPTELNVKTTVTPAGSLTATFDQNKGRVVALNGTESQTIEVDGKTVAHSRSILWLDYVGTEVLVPAKLAALRAVNSRLETSVAATPLSVAVSKEESETSIERTELATDNLGTLLADLARLESASGDQNETPLYLKFKALIYLHPESSAALGRMLATADAKSLTMRVLTGALGAVGNPEAQAALVSAIKARPTDWPALSMLIPALSDASAPTPLAEETVSELAFRATDPNIASTAQLTLGTMAHSLAETSPERAARIVSSFVERINPATSADTTRQLLLALGNAGTAQAYPTIARFTTDPSPALRAAAATALRWVDTDQAGAQLITILASDAEPAVRLEAANALGFRPLNADSFAAQKRALATDKDEKVRQALLSNFWKGRAAFPEARALVEKAAAGDESEEVRKAATEFLATGQTHF